MYSHSIRLFLFALLIAAMFPGLSARAQTETSKDFAEKMEAYLSEDANVAKVGEALERYFVKRREEQRQEAAEAEREMMEDQFENPVDIAIGNSPVKGPEDAPVTVVEFSDFQCPYCARAAQTMEDVLKEYPKNVKLVFKHLPLTFHPQAKPAAVASLAAREQGKFWEMHDLLFENQEKLGPDLYIELAKKLELDVEKFKKDLENEELAKEVEQDAALAAKHGIRGTPGFFVNGVQVNGARPLPYFKMLIDKWLEKKS